MTIHLSTPFANSKTTFPSRCQAPVYNHPLCNLTSLPPSGLEWAWHGPYIYWVNAHQDIPCFDVLYNYQFLVVCGSTNTASQTGMKGKHLLNNKFYWKRKKKKWEMNCKVNRKLLLQDFKFFGKIIRPKNCGCQTHFTEKNRLVAALLVDRYTTHYSYTIQEICTTYTQLYTWIPPF